MRSAAGCGMADDEVSVQMIRLATITQYGSTVYIGIAMVYSH